MSEGSGLKQLVSEEVSDQVDVTDLLGDGGIEDGIDGGDIGASVGRRFGEQIGRELGASIGRRIHETLSRGLEDEKGPGEMRSDLTAAVRSGFDEALEEHGVRDSAESMAASVTEDSSLEGVLETDEEEADESDAGDGGDAEESTDDTADSETEATETQADEESDDDESGPSAEDLEDLRRETLADFLGVLSYQDLQSIAKDVGVKANLSQEEMTDRIIETVAGEDGDEAEGEAESE